MFLPTARHGKDLTQHHKCAADRGGDPPTRGALGNFSSMDIDARGSAEVAGVQRGHTKSCWIGGVLRLTTLLFFTFGGGLLLG